MIRMILWTVLFLYAGMPLSRAELVIFKNGNSVEGKIIERDGQKIKMMASGIEMTYYLDEIEVIDGVVPSATPPPHTLAPAATKGIASTSPGVPSTLSGLSKKELILKFIDVFGTRTSLTQNFDQLIQEAPPAQAKELENKVDVDELIEALVPLYDKYFTEEELKAYIKFYSSPAGKKLVETIPHVMTDSVGVSLKYFKTKLPNTPVQGMK